MQVLVWVCNPFKQLPELTQDDQPPFITEVLTKILNVPSDESFNSGETLVVLIKIVYSPGFKVSSIVYSL